MTDLATLVGAFKRGVAVPGGFSVAFPTATDMEIAQKIGDAAAAAQRDGFFRDKLLDLDENTITPDLTPSEVATVMVYATEQTLLHFILNMAGQREYTGPGGVGYKASAASNVLVEILKHARETRLRLLDTLKETGTIEGGFHMVDAYPINDQANYGPPWTQTVSDNW